MTTTDVPLGNVINTKTAPTTGARQVEAQLPDLLLTQEHHMCPGCGEPVAVRQFLETITQLDGLDPDGNYKLTHIHHQWLLAL